MAELWKGAPAAQSLTEALELRTARLRENGITPTLAIVRLGERPEDLAYERGALSRCGRAGVTVRQFLLPADADQIHLLEILQRINGDSGIHGCLLFRPLPPHIDDDAVRQVLSPAKDVDGITDGSLAGVFSGASLGFPPCTAQACLELLRHYGCSPAGKRVVVVGRSLVIGRPVSMLLLRENATVTICHTKTRDMAALCREADILIVAAGKPGVVDASFVSPGQVILDVGVNAAPDGRLVGDVDFPAVEPIVAAITPVPGGVGAMTSTVLCAHVVEAAEKLL